MQYILTKKGGDKIFIVTVLIFKCISMFSVKHNTSYFDRLLSSIKFRPQVFGHHQTIVQRDECVRKLRAIRQKVSHFLH